MGLTPVHDRWDRLANSGTQYQFPNFVLSPRFTCSGSAGNNVCNVFDAIKEGHPMKRTSRLLILTLAVGALAFAAFVPLTAPLAAEEKVILTPKPGPEPRINGARIFGVRPGSPFLFTIPATGERPMTFAVEGLPDGLAVDAATGQI